MMCCVVRSSRSRVDKRSCGINSTFVSWRKAVSQSYEDLKNSQLGCRSLAVSHSNRHPNRSLHDNIHLPALNGLGGRVSAP